jgi:hypothetical protein
MRINRQNRHVRPGFGVARAHVVRVHPCVPLCVPRISSTSCDQAIFVDQAIDASLTRHWARSTGSVSRPPRGRAQVYSVRIPAGALPALRRLAEARGQLPSVLIRG